MILTTIPYFLKFHRPFALAHGTRTGTQLVFVKIEFENIVAYGEASLPPYLAETEKSVSAWVAKQVEKTKALLGLNPFENAGLIPFSSENPAASSALQTAILSWYLAKNEGHISQYFVQKAHLPSLTFTLTKNDFEILPEKLKLADQFTHLKLKLTGSDDDLEFVKAIRKKTSTPFCVDINQGCKNQERAIKLIEQLERIDCVLIEQPLHANDHDGHFWLKERTQLPVIADESIRLLTDLQEYHEAYSGVNIKLLKCGGLFQAQAMLDFCEGIVPKFSILIGCMSESSLGVSTTAALASQCEMADLDAPYLNSNDPFDGFEVVEGKVVLGERATPRFDLV